MSCISSFQEEWNKITIYPISFENQSRLKLLVESAWNQLPKTKSQCTVFKETPLQTEGIKNYYCHLLGFSSPKQISELLGVPVFISGPHRGNEIVFDSSDSFGFYHPEFPIRLRKFMIPGRTNAGFRAATQKVYDEHVAKTARIFFATYRKLISNQNYFESETERYIRLISEKQLEPYYLEKYNLFLHPDFTDGEEEAESAKFQVWREDENADTVLVKQCVGFWIRRRIDGTENSFYSGLEDLIQSYDPEFYKKRTEAAKP
ncbi:hypothetical protein [Leptospira idonii]|uniref:Uncharacterized protein n=1 Tax=Leptospira idonii TaxID=1193500 RepID=A0A4R9M0Y8_9LEPT|nr:hypothetical protein [Leptospira idonii]TGN20353.1 hypothetical protein EHS15_03850 [Leptospira idonii]